MALGTAALAVGDYKTIDVFTGMTLKVNDQVVTPTKSDGTPAEVFAYEGATYVPARFVSENLGAKVDYDAATQTASISGGLTYSDTIAWDGEYDVVVVGLGLAGASAAKTAADAGAKVLVTEKAPEGHEGGNSRVCGQAFVYGYGNEEAVAEYYTALTAGRRIPEALFNTWVKGVANSIDILAQEFGFDPNEVVDMKKDPAMSK